jgi:hypothetical protein
MTIVRILVAALALLCSTVQIDIAHEHHCLVEKAACGTCRTVVAPFAATPPVAATLHVVEQPVLAITAPCDAHDAATVLTDAFRLRAPPLA